MSAPTLTAATAGQNEQLSLSRSDSSSRHKPYSVVKAQYLFKTKIYVCFVFNVRKFVHTIKLDMFEYLCPGCYLD